MGVAVVLLQLTEESHLVLMSDKQVLMSCLVEQLPVRLDVAYLLLVVALRHLVERVL